MACGLYAVSCGLWSVSSELWVETTINLCNSITLNCELWDVTLGYEL